jgi:hypothetical protein
LPYSSRLHVSVIETPEVMNDYKCRDSDKTKKLKIQHNEQIQKILIH